MPDTSKVVSLYKGSVDVKFYAKKHQYYRMFKTDSLHYFDTENEAVELSVSPLDKWEKLPSTTTITKSIFDKLELVNWIIDVTLGEFIKQQERKVKLDEAIAKAKGYRFQVMREAGKLGTEIHNWIEAFITSQLNETDPPDLIETPVEIFNGIGGFLEWYEDNVKEPLASEYIVYHPRMDIPGTLDFVFVNQNEDLEVVDFKTGNHIYPADIMQLAFYAEAYRANEGMLPKATILHLDKTKPRGIPIYDNNHDTNFAAFMAAHYLTRWKEEIKL